jgi:hypothetical protein
VHDQAQQPGIPAAHARNRAYTFHIHDPAGKIPNRTILLADMGMLLGGKNLTEWKITQEGDQSILSVLLSVSIMGHDLDRWIQL